MSNDESRHNRHRELALNYLTKKAESDLSKAQVSLSLLLDNAVGIGDHSTEDFHKNLDEALTMLVDADDRLNALHEYFG
tara:strand:+ start:3803 stop:4039 length:237 start_codon:yes stop_codon:yes gene_type:complete